MKKFVSIFLLVVLISFYPDTTVILADNTVPVPEIHAESCILIDAVTGNVLLEKNADKKEYPASTTKIMTAGLAIEMGYSDKKAIVSKDAVERIGDNGSNMALKAGEVVPFSDLLNMALISSANDAANALAEGAAGSIDAFVGLMNDKAAQLGLVNTHFSNPVGLDEGDGYPTHQTTASDLAQIMRFSTSQGLFRDTIGKTRYLLPITNFHQSIRGYKTSTDQLLTDPGFKNGAYTVVGGKTGYTKAAQNVFVACARNNDGVELILVLMKDPERDVMFQDAADMFDYGFQLVKSGSSPVKKGFYDIRYRGSEDVVNRFYQTGYISDDGDGRFDYAGAVSREEFLKVLANVRGKPAADLSGYGSYTEKAIAEGLADKSWSGNGNIPMTRGEMISVMSRFVQEDPDMAELLMMIKLIKDLDAIPISQRWDTLRVYKAGLISGRVDGTIGVDRNLTREEMVLMLNNYLKYSENGSSLVRMVMNTENSYGTSGFLTCFA